MHTRWNDMIARSLAKGSGATDHRMTQSKVLEPETPASPPHRRTQTDEVGMIQSASSTLQLRSTQVLDVVYSPLGTYPHPCAVVHFPLQAVATFQTISLAMCTSIALEVSASESHLQSYWANDMISL